MFTLQTGLIVKAKRDIYGMYGENVQLGEKLEILDFFYENFAEPIPNCRIAVIYLRKVENKEMVEIEIDTDFLDKTFEKISGHLEISLKEVQAAYNSVIMTENGYMPKNVQDQFQGAWSQEGKSVNEEEKSSLIEALEAMNEENYKESAINVALDNKDEKKFMELTGE